ncbi:MAG: flavocytochrome c [Lachnospiraceae bacterium]|nr:flavocytochrome c [Lachnospiraceae bacterium]
MVFSIGCGKQDNKNKPDENGTEPKTENQIKNGTYKGSADGRGGEITVEVTIEDDVITAIEVVKQNETPGLDTAMNTLTSEILEKNTLDLDVVSGATITSNAFLEAVTNALKTANATPDMLKKIDVSDTTVKKEDVTETHDIVVVGAGGAGFCAAIEAKAAGADVIILEKLPLAGGNTLISGAEYAAAGNWLQEKEGIKDSPELHAEDMMKGGDNINDPELVKVVTENALAGAEWLRDEIGVVWEDELMQFGGHSVKRSLVPKGASGREIISKQLKKAEEMNIPVLLETKATELITDDNGKVIGVKAEGKDKNYTFNTNKAVIITTGGFGSNLEMRVKYNPEIDEKILSTNSPGSTGDGIVMAEKVGAALVDMEYIQTYPICDPLTGTLLYFDDARLYGYTVIVNKEGKRFVEELGRRDVMSMAIKAQTGSVCYELMDQKAYEESHLEENHSAEIDYLFKNKLLVKADTLEEAAAFFDIDVDEFKKTVANYNKYVKDGKDPEFNKRSLPSTIETAPFYIVKAVPAVHHTMGGIKINTNAQVINTDGKVIEGLYAAGEVTGGIHGTNRLGSDALADITVFGRIAGQNASK